MLACLGMFLTHVWMKRRPSIFWAVLLWFPYTIALLRIAAFLLPGRHPADAGSYAAGFVVLLMAVCYPFFVGLTIFIGWIWPSRGGHKQPSAMT
ncbi:hypothetical protein V3851_18850 [Paenibacillus sp. M1]|uniref:Uncharacterized protein n=1 Tax=Paenibacillus haidiansis TaxID=1574488 RepID=A0ABU7VY86_9BACL